MSFSYRDDDEEPRYTADITGVAISNQTIVILSTLGFGALGLSLFLILRRLSPIEDPGEQEHDPRGTDVYGDMLDQSDVATLNRAQRRARAKFRMKKARRAVAPAQEANGDADGGDPAQAIGADATIGENDGLTRKERQRAAKAREREERKVYAKEARLWREKKQSALISEGSGSCDGQENKGEFHQVANELSFEDVFPKCENEHDALSEFLFWESMRASSIMKNVKQNERSDEIISIAQQFPKVTIREFIERLKINGSVSIATLADEFGISVPEAMDELENNINKKHGVVGIPYDGCFVYVSLEMIEEAVKLGKDLGRIQHLYNS